jgi:hypothetical protein
VAVNSLEPIDESKSVLAPATENDEIHVIPLLIEHGTKGKGSGVVWLRRCVVAALCGCGQGWGD